MDDLKVQGGRLKNWPELPNLNSPYQTDQKFTLDFQEFLQKSLAETNREMIKSDEHIKEMIGGQKDVHETMIALEEANLSLRLLLQIRNKLLAAYEEIMRLQF
ncbi:MAG: flagellar hook-basal body complex protein FliE [Thermodesulfobacteriota bacterium]